MQDEELKRIQGIVANDLLTEVKQKYILEKKPADDVCIEFYEQYHKKLMNKILNVADTEKRIKLWIDFGVALRQFEENMDNVIKKEDVIDEQKLISQGLSKGEIGNTVLVFGKKYKMQYGELDLNSKGISSLNQIVGLTALKNLGNLNLRYNQISDLSALSGLTNLKLLYLTKNKITNLEPLRNLSQLMILYIDNNAVTSIQPLENLRHLSTLEMNGNKVSDLSALKDLKELGTLQAVGNNISDIKPLQNLTKMRFLNLSSNKISDISALRQLTELRYLYLRDNKLTDIGVLRNLTNLNTLYLRGNLGITDRTPVNSLRNVVTRIWDG